MRRLIRLTSSPVLLFCLNQTLSTFVSQQANTAKWSTCKNRGNGKLLAGSRALAVLPISEMSDRRREPTTRSCAFNVLVVTQQDLHIPCMSDVRDIAFPLSHDSPGMIITAAVVQLNNTSILPHLSDVRVAARRLFLAAAHDATQQD